MCVAARRARSRFPGRGLLARRQVHGEGAAHPGLALDLAGRDPEDGLTAIAYDKGAFLLRTIERVVGRPRWDAFLRSYFDRFAFEAPSPAKFDTDINMCEIKQIILGLAKLGKLFGI